MVVGSRDGGLIIGRLTSLTKEGQVKWKENGVGAELKYEGECRDLRFLLSKYPYILRINDDPDFDVFSNDGSLESGFATLWNEIGSYLDSSGGRRATPEKELKNIIKKLSS